MRPFPFAIVLAILLGAAYSQGSLPEGFALSGGSDKASAQALSLLAFSESPSAPENASGDGNSTAFIFSSPSGGIAFMSGGQLFPSISLCALGHRLDYCAESADVYLNSSRVLVYAGTLSGQGASKSSVNSISAPQPSPIEPSAAPLSLPEGWHVLVSILAVIGITAHYFLKRRN